MSVQLEFQNPWFTKIGLPLCKAFAYLLFLIWGPLRVSGKYRIPKSGGLLILSNHLADIDPVAIQVACPREIYFMSKSELFDMKILGKMIRWFRAFPVKRGEPDRESIKVAVGYLQAGKTVCIFPEGQLSEDGALQELKPGVGLIARMAGCNVICVGLKNTNKVIPYGSTIPRPSFRRVDVHWGEPHTFAKDVKVDHIMEWADAQLRSLSE